MNTKTPWDFLEDFRGKTFHGEWPTLPEMFEITTARFPNRNCLTVFEPNRITLSYAQALEKIKTLAAWLNAQGLKKGMKIAVSGKNSPEWAVVYFATLFAGGIIVPIDYGLHEEEIQNLIQKSDPFLFFVDEERYQFFKNNVVLGKDFSSKVYSLNKAHADEYVYNLYTDKTPSIEQAASEDTAAILFTSGTMGNPKGVMLSHKNLVADCYIAQTHLNIFETDVFYALLPLHHSYTMLAVFIEALSVGAEIVFGKTIAVSKMLKELDEGKVTMLLGVPLLFNKLLAGILKGVRAKGPLVYGLIRTMMGISYLVKKLFKVNIGKSLFKKVLAQAKLSTVRIAICGGGPLSPSVFRAYNEFGIDFIQGYGLTETSPIIALNPVEHFKIESVGKYFHPYMEMKILDPDEKGVGEIAVRGPMVMQGYYQMPEETAEVLSSDGWFKTGDIGRLDEEGYLYLSGRAKNLIVTEGGKNVYPEEIENMFQLYYDDIEQITAMGYLLDKETKSEGIEVKVYPTDALYKKLNFERDSAEGDAAVLKHIQEIVDLENKKLLPYQKISRVTILDKPFEMTTTKKVIRR
ncbi:long-chain fatty acid--CoA ligase [Treponema phagedenis]|uniref:AMP-binding enzyme n=1 Tax=Treponema phagedenis TaxID=162 RepID=A0A0B7GU23_TREPH|nr:AMP-binding protein [Treponema phagedenis]EFW37264.1 AMP-binding enzyme [Treponema phagedenis F0421]QSH98981.1 long-chain fatty acid--CoA ligase [Treponema phagedenis]CEM62164.1 AMP-binding enzyme [Treponema phagedenis]